MSNKLTTHNVEQAARGYAIFELARLGYVVQPTDSRFPTEDLLVVSPEGKHFGIDVKGQRTKNFWIMKEPRSSDELFYFLIYLETEGLARLFILDSIEMSRLWHEYKNRILKNSGKDDNIWGVNWITPFPYENNWDALPR